MTGASQGLPCSDGFEPPEPDRDVSELRSPSPHAARRSPQEGLFDPWAADPRSKWGMLRWVLPRLIPHDESGSPPPDRVANEGAGLPGREGPPSLTSHTWVGHATLVVDHADRVRIFAIGERRRVPDSRSTH